MIDFWKDSWTFLGCRNDNPEHRVNRVVFFVGVVPATFCFLFVVVRDFVIDAFRYLRG